MLRNTKGDESPVSPLLASAVLSDESIRSASVNDASGVPDTRTVELHSPTCPLYRLPELGHPPDLPYDQLSKLQDGHPEQFDKVIQNQMNELYAYIATMKKTLRESHLQYLLACQVYLNGH